MTNTSSGTVECLHVERVLFHLPDDVQVNVRSGDAVVRRVAIWDENTVIWNRWIGGHADHAAADVLARDCRMAE